MSGKDKVFLSDMAKADKENYSDSDSDIEYSLSLASLSPRPMRPDGIPSLDLGSISAESLNPGLAPVQAVGCMSTARNSIRLDQDMFDITMMSPITIIKMARPHFVPPLELALGCGNQEDLLRRHMIEDYERARRFGYLFDGVIEHDNPFVQHPGWHPEHPPRFVLPKMTIEFENLLLDYFESKGIPDHYLGRFVDEMMSEINYEPYDPTAHLYDNLTTLIKEKLVRKSIMPRQTIHDKRFNRPLLLSYDEVMELTADKVNRHFIKMELAGIYKRQLEKQVFKKKHNSRLEYWFQSEDKVIDFPRANNDEPKAQKYSPVSPLSMYSCGDTITRLNKHPKQNKTNYPSKHAHRPYVPLQSKHDRNVSTKHPLLTKTKSIASGLNERKDGGKATRKESHTVRETKASRLRSAKLTDEAEKEMANKKKNTLPPVRNNRAAALRMAMSSSSSTAVQPAQIARKDSQSPTKCNKEKVKAKESTKIIPKKSDEKLRQSANKKEPALIVKTNRAAALRMAKSNGAAAEAAQVKTSRKAIKSSSLKPQKGSMAPVPPKEPKPANMTRRIVKIKVPFY